MILIMSGCKDIDFAVLPALESISDLVGLVPHLDAPAMQVIVLTTRGRTGNAPDLSPREVVQFLMILSSLTRGADRSPLWRLHARKRT